VVIHNYQHFLTLFKVFTHFTLFAPNYYFVSQSDIKLRKVGDKFCYWKSWYNLISFITPSTAVLLTYVLTYWWRKGHCVASEDGDEATWEDRVPDEQRLFEQLLVDCEPAVRPVYNSSQPVLIHFQLGLYQIVDLVGCLFCLFLSLFLLFLTIAILTSVQDGTKST